MLKRTGTISILKPCFSITFILFTFLVVQALAQTSYHHITVTQDPNGVITPLGTSGIVTIPDGGSKKFTLTPHLHYHIEDAFVDGSSVKEFLRWEGKIAYYTLANVMADHEITAAFSIDTPTLTVSKVGTGSGVISGTGIDCGVDCDNSYDWGTSIELTATSDSGSVFKGWFVAGTLVSKNPVRTITVTGNKKITAKFSKIYTLTVSKAGAGNGSIKSYLVSGINCGSECSETYLAGKQITLIAQPDRASKFAGWSGDTAGTSKQITISLDSDKTIVATFGEKAQALRMAKKVGVVETSSGLGSHPVFAGRVGLSPGDLPPDSDFFNDQTNICVEERSARELESVNEILCKIAQTKYDELLNYGTYKAQVDVNLCRSGRDDPSNGGERSQNESSGANMPNYELWVVNSSRTDDSSPQIVKFWIHQRSDGGADDIDKIILAKAVITEGVEETPPFGLFTISWKAYPDTKTPIEDRPVMAKGFMRTEREDTGKLLLKFIIHADFAIPGTSDFVIYTKKAVLDRAADGSTGGGTVSKYDNNSFLPEPTESIFDIAYDPGYFLREEKLEPPVQRCLSRTNFSETAWSYGLYDSNGARVNRDSGFSFRATIDGKDYYGWIGYWGIWFPKEVTINDGKTVYKQTFGAKPEPYTLLEKGGKLTKHAKKTITLGEIRNVLLEYVDPADQIRYRVKWDGTDFLKVAWLNGEGIWESIDPPVALDLTNLNFDILNFWSHALNGNTQVQLNYLGGCTLISPDPVFSCPASDATPVTFDTHELVYPDDIVPSTLYCFNNCPDVTKLSTEAPFNDYSNLQLGKLPTDPTVGHAQYTFDTNSMVLKAGVEEVIATSVSSNYSWGLVSGPLFSEAYLGLLACEMDSGNPADPDSTCGYRAWSDLPEYYTWETGPNDWNQFTALLSQSDGIALRFDPPLLVSYAHTWLDLTTSTFQLDYSSFGNLSGIPGICVDEDTGQEVPCSPDTRWIPQFTIPEGSELTDITDNVTKYLVKPLDIERRMGPLDLASCEGLTLTSYSLPDISDYSDFDIGPEPVLTDPPRVIGGILQ